MTRSITSAILFSVSLGSASPAVAAFFFEGLSDFSMRHCIEETQNSKTLDPRLSDPLVVPAGREELQSTPQLPLLPLCPEAKVEDLKFKWSK